MKNKQHEYIIQAFLQSKVPQIFKEYPNDLLILDSILGGYCTQALKREKVDFITSEIFSKKERELISNLISKSDGLQKNELVIYYRLAILVESIIYFYK